MNRRQFVGGAAATSAGVGLAGCQQLGFEWRYNYRLIAEVLHDGKLYAGSSVVEIVRQWGPSGIGGYPRGSAAVVEMGEAGALFVLLSSDKSGYYWPIDIAHRMFANVLGGPETTDAARLSKLASLRDVSAVLKQEDYPKMARFQNDGEAASIQEVTTDNIAILFGAGTQLRRIVLQLTTDRADRAIFKRLPWLPTLRGAILPQPDNVMTADLLFAGRITDGEFVRGIKP